MSPRADFVCLANRCQQDGQATVYELPVSATRCPVCGSRRIQRLYNAVNVSRGIASGIDTAIASTQEHYQDVRNSAKRAEERTAALMSDQDRQRYGLPYCEPIGGGYVAAQPGTARPAQRHADPFLQAQLPKMGPRPGPGSKAVTVNP